MVIDIGTGDGSYVLKKAREKPNTFFIGIDSNADNLRESSQKAAKRPDKGGLSNVLFVHANAESLPKELFGLAHEVTVNLPWGSLLTAVAKPDVSVLQEIAKICRPKASLSVIFGYELCNEQKMIEQCGLPELNPLYLNTILTEAYLRAGFTIQWCYLTQDELKKHPTTWAKKLGFGKKRQFIAIQGVAS